MFLSISYDEIITVNLASSPRMTTIYILKIVIKDSQVLERKFLYNKSELRLSRSSEIKPDWHQVTLILNVYCLFEPTIFTLKGQFYRGKTNFKEAD
jgi:hypothetical protein